jgi:hypothetical protein
MFAMPFIMGNVAVSFAVLSYAGTLAITILPTPSASLTQPLAAALRRELNGS